MDSLTPSTPPVKPLTIVPVRDVYGRTAYVAAEHLDDTGRYRVQVPLFTSAGVRVSDLPRTGRDPRWGGASTIHRDNIGAVLAGRVGAA